MMEAKPKMEINTTDLLIVFDNILPQTPEDEAAEKYTFICNRMVEFDIYLHVDPQNNYCYIATELDHAYLRLVEFKFCKRVRVIDMEKKFIEIVGGSPDALNVCCSIKLTGDLYGIHINTQYNYHPDF